MTHVVTATDYMDCPFSLLYVHCKHDLYAMSHTSVQHVKCISINEKNKVFNTLVHRIDSTLFNILLHLDAFLQTFAI